MDTPRYRRSGESDKSGGDWEWENFYLMFFREAKKLFEEE
ncbi:21198_t:CDS:2 [Entrophospora sp. SA101]|nr:21198_t:CDS:2 [Entrophospora sp. SA101]